MKLTLHQSPGIDNIEKIVNNICEFTSFPIFFFNTSYATTSLPIEREF